MFVNRKDWLAMTDRVHELTNEVRVLKMYVHGYESHHGYGEYIPGVVETNKAILEHLKLRTKVVSEVPRKTICVDIKEH